jgi:molybdopterin synthase sulfur carrier subunit
LGYGASRMPNVRLNGRLRQIARTKEMEVPGDTVQELVDNLRSSYGERFALYLERSTVLVNEKNVKNLEGQKTRLEPDDIVSIYPPMGGG